MSSDATRLPDGALELRARAKATANNSPYELELYLLKGGKLLDWYASVGVRIVPTENPEDARERTAQRLLAACPKGLGEEQTRAWVGNALRDAGASPLSLTERVEAGAIRREFVSFCDHVRAVVDRAEAGR